MTEVALKQLLVVSALGIVWKDAFRIFDSNKLLFLSIGCLLTFRPNLRPKSRMNIAELGK